MLTLSALLCLKALVERLFVLVLVMPVEETITTIY